MNDKTISVGLWVSLGIAWANELVFRGTDVGFTIAGAGMIIFGIAAAMRLNKYSKNSK